VNDEHDPDSPALPFTTTLEDGTRVLVRYLEPSDRKELQKGFLRLSTVSRWLRFASPIRRLSEGQLKYLTEVDQINHIALGARDEGHPRKAGIAVARCVRLNQDSPVAEFAITVVDDYQNRGIGRLLLQVLMAVAAQRGILTLRGFVLASNSRMLHILEGFGARLKGRLDGTVDAQIDLPPPPTDAEPGGRRPRATGGSSGPTEPS
jgi:GNAT superfamily N-acetyltransferase